MQKLRWGILGTGKIARKFAKALEASERGELVAVASRTDQRAVEFGRTYGASRQYGGYAALLKDPEVDAVYIALPNQLHAPWCVRAAEAGKHILCEKPLTINAWEAQAVVEAARSAGVFLLEGYMTQFHPLTRKWLGLISKGVIGRPVLLEATFSFVSAGKGGSIMDLGCYCVSAARHAAGAVEGKAFANPVDVKGSAVMDPENGFDISAAAVLKFECGMLARIACGREAAHENVLRITGTDGVLTVPAPWIAEKEGGPSTILLQTKDRVGTRRIRVECEKPVFALEADAVAEYASGGEAPEMTPEDSLGNMAALDAWRESAGVELEAETARGFGKPLRGGHLRRRRRCPMKYGRITGVDRPVSRLVMGVDNQRSFAHAAVLFDDFVEQGGNTFDTAHAYGGGRLEKLLGTWMRSRGVRRDMNVVVKGAHTPFCTPAALREQFEISLERLQIEKADIYLMHRDNPDVPVGEFVDVLDELKRRGKIGVFGGSNWTRERLDAAKAYAKKKRKTAMGVVSNNFSLARMMDPVWAGCVAASEDAFRRWLEKERMPLLAWSSQARGFFTERAGPEVRGDAEMVRCWYSEENFERRNRAISLAEKRGVDPINVALAYVLAQAFPTFALVGPRTLREWRSTLPGLSVELTPEELAWLDLRSL